jgi:NAD+ kinase
LSADYPHLTPTGQEPPKLGLIVHPTRDIEQEMATLCEWTRAHGGELAQVGEERREVAERGTVEHCDLIVTLGGDGTALMGMAAAAESDRPVLGVACGSLGVLTSVAADDLPRALDRFFADDWIELRTSVLEVERDDGGSFNALNDVALIRSGEGQVTTEARVDGVLYARVVGDGFVVSTPVGSSAYTMAAGGPLLAPGAAAFVLTPLAIHGGSVPPLVIGSESSLELQVDIGHGSARLEVDGHSEPSPPVSLSIALRTEAATVVSFEDSEPLLGGLRRREVIRDSPRVIARDQRGDS